MDERDDRGLIYSVLQKLNLYSKLDEYYDVGLVGLARGIKTFNEALGIQRSTYYTHCIRNEIVKEFIKNKRKKRLTNETKISLNSNVFKEDNGAELIDFIPDHRSDIEKQILQKEKINEIKIYVNTKLNKKYRDIFISYYIDEVPTAKIAEKYGVTACMINVYARKIRKMIRKGIEFHER